MLKVSAYGKRKPTLTMVACRTCNKIYVLDSNKRCPKCGTQYMIYRRINKEGWY